MNIMNAKWSEDTDCPCLKCGDVVRLKHHMGIYIIVLIEKGMVLADLYQPILRNPASFVQKGRNILYSDASHQIVAVWSSVAQYFKDNPHG